MCVYASSLVWTRSREGKERLNTSCEAGSKSGGGALPAARRIRFSSYLGYMSSIPGARRAAFPENKSREEKKNIQVSRPGKSWCTPGESGLFCFQFLFGPGFFFVLVVVIMLRAVWDVCATHPAFPGSSSVFCCYLGVIFASDTRGCCR